jgi:Heterokaryon incompatibility protein (HET)
MLADDRDFPLRHIIGGTSEGRCIICRISCSILRYLKSRSSEYGTHPADESPQIGPTDFDAYEHWVDHLGINHSREIRCLKLFFQITEGYSEQRYELERFFWTFPDLHESQSPQIRKKSDEEMKHRRVNYDLIRSWISICEMEHTKCRRSVHVRQKPQVELFVIDVSTRTITKAPKDCHYIALSYVCGDVLPNLEGLTAESWRLDSGTSHERLPDVIPRTIEDAMVVVRELNYRYLWVDAYCISQFDALQRAYFISCMDQIYEGAVLTIVALSGSHSNAGLAGVSTPLTHWLQSTVETIQGTLMVTEVKPITSVFRNSNWSARAWTLQEGTLSRHCLCFERDTYFLWCREELFSEVMKIDSHPDRFRCTVFPFLRPHCFGLDFNEDKFAMDEFQDMLQAYTARQLTRSSDAHNAIIGMLNRVSASSGVKFSYGMPTEPNLIYSMLWTGARNVRLRRRPGFPSWSWLGWEGKITCTSFWISRPWTFDESPDDFRAPGFFRPGYFLSAGGGTHDNDFAWQVDSASPIEYPTELDESQELRVTAARATFPLVMLVRDGDSLPNGEAVGDIWTMVDNDGQSIGTEEFYIDDVDPETGRPYTEYGKSFRAEYGKTFRVEPEISAELDKVRSAAEFLLLVRWKEAHESGELKDPEDYKEIGDLVWAILIIRNSDNTARRVAMVTMDYHHWIQGDPQSVEVVLV